MSRYRGPLLFLFVFLVLTVGISGAVENIEQTHIQHFSLSAPEGMSLSGVEMYDLDPTSNTTILLDNYGELYTLQINSTKDYAFWWNFDISLTSPNGTVQTQHLKSSAPFASDYDLFIQYYWMSINGTYDSVFDLDLYTGVLPLNCQLNDWNPTKSEALQFSEITADSNSYFDLLVYAVDDEEFAEQLGNDVIANLQEGTGDLFAWSWEMIIAFIEKIPLIGPYLAAILMLTAMTLNCIVFYFDLFFIEYPETTFLTTEFFILSYATTKRGNFWRKLKCVVDCHTKLIEIVISVTRAAVNLFTSIIHAVSNALSAIKP